MKKITIDRFLHGTKETFGTIHLGDEFLGFTVEQPWRDNIQFRSCVPTGTYTLVPFKSQKYGDTYCIVNENLNVYKEKRSSLVRYACLIHAANYARQLQGCIAPGLWLSNNGSEHMVTSSKKAVKKLLDYIDDDDTVWEREPLERLAKDGQLMAYQHTSFWQCMDTLREKYRLESYWQTGNAPWKIWEE